MELVMIDAHELEASRGRRSYRLTGSSLRRWWKWAHRIQGQKGTVVRPGVTPGSIHVVYDRKAN